MENGMEGLKDKCAIVGVGQLTHPWFDSGNTDTRT